MPRLLPPPTTRSVPSRRPNRLPSVARPLVSSVASLPPRTKTSSDRASSPARPGPGPAGFVGASLPPRRPSARTTAAAGSDRPSSSEATTGGTMATTSIQAHLTPALLGEVRDFWFAHLSGPDAAVLPSADDNKRWFSRSDDMDSACVQRFGPTLEAIRHAGVRSGAEIVAAARPADARDWLSLVILLDQIPRNCYRGSAAAVAFCVFDPLARDVALAAIGRGIAGADAQMRWQFAYRLWFYLPLMHAEEAAAHERAAAELERLRDDALGLVSGDDGPPEPPERGGEDAYYRARAARVVRADVDAARRLVDQYVAFEKQHGDIIRRFGRYPHRNKALGRVSTADETAFLEAGGETFGG